MADKKFVDKLFEADNNENIILYDEDDSKTEFEQVAVVDYKEKYYAILHPVTEVEGVEEDEAFVFEINEDEDCLEIVDDFDLAEKVFEEYYKLLDEEEE
jgi:hypothetical protein